jgi:membrane protease YdiL (CAAX protease family)
MTFENDNLPGPEDPTGGDLAHTGLAPSDQIQQPLNSAGERVREPVGSPVFTQGAEQQIAGALPMPPAKQLPDDLRVPWDWLDLFILVMLALGGTFVFLILIMMVLSLFGIKPAQLQKNPDEWTFVAVFSQILLDLALLGYLAAQMRLRFRKPFWRTIGWRPLPGGAARGTLAFALICGGVLLAALVSAGSALFPPKGPLPIEKILLARPTALLFMVTAVLVAPVVEETIFRGYLYPVVARAFGVGTGIVITGALFGLLHSIQLWGGWWQIWLLIMVGIIFTWVRAATKTVAASWLLHISYNSVQVLALLIAMRGPRHFPFLH